ncbi:unnamed protein product, partial [Iphiclides podalirius]
MEINNARAGSGPKKAPGEPAGGSAPCPLLSSAPSPRGVCPSVPSRMKRAAGEWRYRTSPLAEQSPIAHWPVTRQLESALSDRRLAMNGEARLRERGAPRPRCDL